MRHFDKTDGTSILYRERRPFGVVWIVESICRDYRNWIWEEHMYPEALAQMMARKGARS